MCSSDLPHVAAVPKVRDWMKKTQRECIQFGSLVMEGRDIGTVVCSDSPYKFFIDACPKVRAERRKKQGQSDNLAARDKLDSSRAAAPLIRAADARLLDSGKADARSLADLIVKQVRASLKPSPTAP